VKEEADIRQALRNFAIEGRENGVVSGKGCRFREGMGFFWR
jgi:hypothetical protein